MKSFFQTKHFHECSSIKLIFELHENHVQLAVKITSICSCGLNYELAAVNHCNDSEI